MRYAEAYDIQRSLVEQRQQGRTPDHLLLVEHPHVVTLGRNGCQDHVLASDGVLARSGIEFHHTNRGGDATYHGPGQLVGYPILDLQAWRRDVRAYVQAIEEVIIRAVGRFGVAARHSGGGPIGVWVGQAKLAAIGIHISRWVTSHGFALNIDTDLRYFQYIVPCGLALPVTSLRELGCQAPRVEVAAALQDEFGSVFGCHMLQETKQELRQDRPGVPWHAGGAEERVSHG